MTCGPIRPTFVHDRSSEPSSVIALEFLARQASGLRFGATLELPATVVVDDLVPTGAIVDAAWTDPYGVHMLAGRQDFALSISASRWGTTVQVAAAQAPRLEELVASLDQCRPALPVSDVDVTFWNWSSSSIAERRTRALQTAEWTEISRNYPSAARTKLQELVEREGVDAAEGRLILLHGEPGTGKTTAVRALVSEWKPWCDVHLIIDPDRLFADSSYLLEVLQAGNRKNAPTLTRAAGPERCKLIVAEDADAYLRSTARNDSGAALGRLLNTTDGLLAQSTKVLVLLTTNEPLARLHPAVTRPGRCLAEIEVGRFDQKGADDWLGGAAKAPPGGATLAELYSLQRTGRAPHDGLRIGTYL